jgi:hypothetical protein
VAGGIAAIGVEDPCDKIRIKSATAAVATTATAASIKLMLLVLFDANSIDLMRFHSGE